MPIITAARNLFGHKLEEQIRKPIVDLNQQTHQHNDDPNVRHSIFVKSGEFLLRFDKDIRTVLDCMYHGLEVSGDSDCLGFRDPELNSYKWYSYKEIIYRMRCFGSGLITLGIEPKNSTYVSIYGVNSVEWIISEYACYHYSMCVVPLFHMFGPSSCEFILNKIEAKCVIVDSNDKIEKLLKLTEKIPSMSIIILMNENIYKELLHLSKQKGIALYSFSEIEIFGEGNFQEIKPPESTDLACNINVIGFTSGTTGNHKGAMLTHANLIAAASGALMHITPYFDLRKQTMISYLPLAHCFERMAQICIFYSGGRIGVYSGTIKYLPKDLKALKPTMMPCVPRIFNRIYTRLINQVNSNRVHSKLLDVALKSKQLEVEKFITRSDGIWDSIIFKEIRESLGGNLRFILSGSAPLSPTVLNFMRCAFGCVVIEGYGQTECSAPATLTHCGDYSAGHVGAPIPSNTIKIIDVPEMNIYAHQNGMGEICVKGTNVFVGYYKDLEKTKEVLDDDGWLHTGDIGQWQKNGTLKILDRKKHIFKLSNGEYIAPEKIEGVYIQSAYVAQCYVHGENYRSCLVGIIVPDADRINIWCQANSMILRVNEACRNSLFKKAVLYDLLSIGEREGLLPFEQVRDIYLHDQHFSSENSLLTPTMKLKRSHCYRHFKDQIEDMYGKMIEETF